MDAMDAVDPLLVKKLVPSLKDVNSGSGGIPVLYNTNEIADTHNFCGKLSFRWRPSDESLPPTCLGHIGYAVVPWKRNAGAATAALGLMLPLIAPTGLRFVDVTTDAENVASIRVIERNGGIRTGEVRGPFAPDELRLLLRIQL